MILNFTAFLFYIFSAIMLMSASMVVASKNTVHSVLFLILAFFNGAGLFILAGAEFLAMLLVVVYVGAVAVLFLFVVMMLNVDRAAIKNHAMRYKTIGGILGGVLLVELILVAVGWQTPSGASALNDLPINPSINNTYALGQVLYTHYFLLFQAAGFILLLAMIGAIVLTLRHRPGVRRQNISDQIARDKNETLELVDVPLREGV